jgi:hypothetical protein
MSARARGVNAARVRIDPLTHEQATPSGAGAQGLRSADKAGMNQVAVRQDARLAATAGWDGTVRIFDLRKQLRLLAALTYHRDGVHTVAFATAPPASDQEGADCRAVAARERWGGRTDSAVAPVPSDMSDEPDGTKRSCSCAPPYENTTAVFP